MTSTMTRDIECEACGQTLTLTFQCTGYTPDDDGIVKLHFETTPESTQAAYDHVRAHVDV